MPRCYLLASCSGSSVDQQSNNVTLFNLVEQINVAPGAPPPPRGLVPVEVHAYFHVAQHEFGRDFEVRFVMVAQSGLETPTDTFTHRAMTPRFRTRTFGLPFPPVSGHYELRVDVRLAGEESFRREPITWPITIVETSPPETRAVH
ncbi:MAG TPA: hypothetical protein VH062_14705 [Polyangiaceae bacterium]|jgi:hypothetical protein|nr:hypothetical protein [Polyangiaceae bacterium]